MVGITRGWLRADPPPGGGDVVPGGGNNGLGGLRQVQAPIVGAACRTAAARHGILRPGGWGLAGRQERKRCGAA
jgi:hypothetical protein